METVYRVAYKPRYKNLGFTMQPRIIHSAFYGKRLRAAWKPRYKKPGFTIQTRIIQSAFYGKRLPRWMEPRYKKLRISTNQIIRAAWYGDQDKINYKLFLLN